jgi:hypothetical protein
LQSINRVRELHAGEYASAYTDLMDEISSSGSLVSVHSLPYLIESWAADDPAGMCRTLLDDPRCFDYELGLSAIPALLKYHSNELLRLCQTKGLRKIAAYAAQHESADQKAFYALAQNSASSVIKSREDIPEADRAWLSDLLQ